MHDFATYAAWIESRIMRFMVEEEDLKDLECIGMYRGVLIRGTTISRSLQVLQLVHVRQARGGMVKTRPASSVPVS